MSLNIWWYKKDIHPDDEKWINEIKKAREQLSNALENYFGSEVTVDDIIALTHQKIRLKNHTKNSWKDIADIFSPWEITFWWHWIYWYSSAITLWNKIIAIKWDNVDTLSIWQNIIIKWNSAWYIPSAHKDGDIVTIIWFTMPFSEEEWSNDDTIIKVYWDNKEWSIKPSNINKEETNSYNSKIKIK
jgi:hypothetical protein